MLDFAQQFSVSCSLLISSGIPPSSAHYAAIGVVLHAGALGAIVCLYVSDAEPYTTILHNLILA